MKFGLKSYKPLPVAFRGRTVGVGAACNFNGAPDEPAIPAVMNTKFMMEFTNSRSAFCEFPPDLSLPHCVPSEKDQSRLTSLQKLSMLSLATPDAMVNAIPRSLALILSQEAVVIQS